MPNQRAGTARSTFKQRGQGEALRVLMSAHQRKLAVHRGSAAEARAARQAIPTLPSVDSLSEPFAF